MKPSEKINAYNKWEDDFVRRYAFLFIIGVGAFFTCISFKEEIQAMICLLLTMFTFYGLTWNDNKIIANKRQKLLEELDKLGDMP